MKSGKKVGNVKEETRNEDQENKKEKREKE